ncbi:AAA family ATPase, partial [Streptomyces sp. NPDC002812]|uniref:tetratricopeptide repeat protein n=1 Tax=Streptomyces sp. NPDC002812 TaxID=3154434 RepID=UPI00332E9D0B
MAERDRELAGLVEVLDDGSRGRGSAALVQAGTGCGRTEMLDALRGVAVERGFLVLRATGAGPERRVEGGVLRQLLTYADVPAGLAGEWARIAEVGVGVGGGVGARWPPGAESAGALHELSAAILRISERAPVLLCVDDIELADSLSLYWILHLARNLRSSRIALVAAECTPTRSGRPSLHAELLRQPNHRRIVLEPLSPAAVATVLAGHLGVPAAAALAEGFHRFSGGNPLLVRALVEDQRRAVPRGQVPYEPVVAGAYADTVLSCLRRAGPLALRLARVLAALDGAETDAGLPARLLDEEAGAVEECRAALEAAGLLDGGRLRHPVARSAVLRGLSASARRELHRGAAELLHRDGANALRIAPHLLAAGRAHPSWAVPVLEEAAERHLEADRPQDAHDCLALALAVSRDEDERVDLRARLAALAWVLDPTLGTRHYGELARALRDGRLPGRHALALARRLLWHGRFEEAAEAVEAAGRTRAPGQVPDPDPATAEELRATRGLLPAGRAEPSATGTRRAGVPGGVPAGGVAVGVPAGVVAAGTLPAGAVHAGVAVGTVPVRNVSAGVAARVASVGVPDGTVAAGTVPAAVPVRAVPAGVASVVVAGSVSGGTLSAGVAVGTVSARGASAGVSAGADPAGVPAGTEPVGSVPAGSEVGTVVAGAVPDDVPGGAGSVGVVAGTEPVGSLSAGVAVGMVPVGAAPAAVSAGTLPADVAVAIAAGAVSVGSEPVVAEPGGTAPAGVGAPGNELVVAGPLGTAPAGGGDAGSELVVAGPGGTASAGVGALGNELVVAGPGGTPPAGVGAPGSEVGGVGTVGVGAGGVPGGGDVRVRAAVALADVLAHGPGGSGAVDAEEPLRGMRLGWGTQEWIVSAVTALVLAERLEAAESWCELRLAEARGRRVPLWEAEFTSLLAGIRLRQGDPRAARRLAEAALALVPAESWGAGLGGPLSVLVRASTETGDHEAAVRHLAVPVPDRMFSTRFGLDYLHARGRHHLEAGRPDEALEDFAVCAGLMRAWGCDRPELVPWRTESARAHLALGDEAAARALAHEQLALAGPHRTRTRGLTLRVLAATADVAERAALLTEAVGVLRAAGDPLETAGALTDLGRAHLREARPDRARAVFEMAARLAGRCGAQPLETVLAAELDGLGPRAGRTADGGACRCPESGSGAGSGCGPDGGSGQGSGCGSCRGSGVGPGRGSSVGPDVVSGCGPDVGAGAGADAGSGTKSGRRVCGGLGCGSGVGPDVGSGCGPDVGAGAGADAGSGTKSGRRVCGGLGCGSGVGPDVVSGCGPDVGAGAGADAGSGTKSGRRVCGGLGCG